MALIKFFRASLSIFDADNFYTAVNLRAHIFKGIMWPRPLRWRLYKSGFQRDCNQQRFILICI